MNAKDFIFDRYDSEYEDYWFKVTGDTKKELTDKYMEMCMIEVTEVVYSVKEDIVGVKQLFPFNYQVIEPTDETLKNLLIDLIKNLPKVENKKVKNKDDSPPEVLPPSFSFNELVDQVIKMMEKQIEYEVRLQLNNLT